MGVTAENLAEGGAISRERQDAFAVRSHRVATEARAEGRSADQIVPVPLDGRRGPSEFTDDEHIREDASPETMARLKPVFNPDGAVTAGNASGINDAGAAVVLMSAQHAAELGAPVRARVLAYASCGGRTLDHGDRPRPRGPEGAPAMRPLAGEVQVIELNEAFAAQALAAIDELRLDEEKVNPTAVRSRSGIQSAATGAASPPSQRRFAGSLGPSGAVDDAVRV